MLGATAANKCLSLEVRYENDMPSFVSTDRSIVKQILLNLVGNAIKFTTQGSVRVITSYETTDLQPVWHLAVQDTGCGIPATALTKLFEPFFQANNSLTAQTGTGLGLHLSRRWAKMLGAEGIEVVSAIGVGTKFSVAIPAPLGQAVPVQVAPIVEASAAPQPQRVGLRILVAEVNKVNQHVLLRLLDGLQATQEIRKLECGLHRVPIIAVVANAFEEDKQQCMAAEMDDYIAKPITIEALSALISKWRAKQEALS